jgi:hypothetical protein
MTGYSLWTAAAVVVVAFIAGYSVVSYVARKLKASQVQTTPGLKLPERTKKDNESGNGQIE